MNPGHNRLVALAGEIAEHHRAAGAATREVIRHAIEAGRRLAEAKALLPHGQWLPWLRANVPGISARTAQRYLAAAHHAGENDTVSLFRLRDLARRPRPSVDDRIGELLREGTAAAVATGAALADVKARLPAEAWPRWLAAEFGWSPELAAEFIRAHEQPEHAVDVLARLAEEMAALARI
jgi:hypothetical protein